jgi:hypothetical protein
MDDCRQARAPAGVGSGQDMSANIIRVHDDDVRLVSAIHANAGKQDNKKHPHGCGFHCV